MERKRNDLPFPVKIWTSSHGLGSHYFPQSLREVFAENDKIKFPEINAKGGRMITDDFVITYLEEFKNNKNSEPQISVLLLGDNDIRRYSRKGAFKVYKNTKQIIEAHKQSQHPLLLLGLMPSPKTHAETNPISEYLDDTFQQEIQNLHSNPEYRHLGFVSTASFFTNEEGFILNRKYFERDGVHLKKDGALTLATNILENAKLLVDAIQSYTD